MFPIYPYLNVNDLNLDYILNAIKQLKNDVTNFVSINAIKYADPIQWDITRQYEKNTVVIDPLTGTAYISVAPVPMGVALTRPEYWTVVFDLGSFVTRAAQNFTEHYEPDTTLTATFSSNANDWLIWGDVLYKALTNINAGDAYVIGSNIEHFTIEDLYVAYLQTIDDILNMIGDLSNLDTVDKSNIVNAINEVNERTYEKGTVANIYVACNAGDDENDGLTSSLPMKTLEGAYSKYSDHTYVNIIIIESGDYPIGDNLDTNLRFYTGGHASVINALTGVTANITGYMYWIGSHVEFWNVTVKSRIDMRSSTVVIDGAIIDSIDTAYFGNCNINVIKGTFETPLNLGHCGLILANAVFNETVSDRVKITSLATKIVFNAGNEINTTVASMTAGFIRAYANTEVTVINLPTFTGKYGTFVWNNGSKVTVANESMIPTINANTNTRALTNFNDALTINSNFTTGAPTYELGSVNFNSYVTPDKYYINSPTGSNRPINATGLLEVKAISNNFIEQYFYPDDTTDLNVYYRKYDKTTTTFSSWVKFEPVAI